MFYFIHGGTLGARRDKKFIEWDWDVEISFYNNDFQNIFDDLITYQKLFYISEYNTIIQRLIVIGALTIKLQLLHYHPGHMMKIKKDILEERLMYLKNF